MFVFYLYLICRNYINRVKYKDNYLFFASPENRRAQDPPRIADSRPPSRRRPRRSAGRASAASPSRRSAPRGEYLIRQDRCDRARGRSCRVWRSSSVRLNSGSACASSTATDRRTAAARTKSCSRSTASRWSPAATW